MHRGRWTLSSFNITIFAVSTARDTASGSFDGDGYQERIHKKSESSERAEKRDTVALHLYFCGGVSAGNGSYLWTNGIQHDVSSDNSP